MDGSLDHHPHVDLLFIMVLDRAPVSNFVLCNCTPTSNSCALSSHERLSFLAFLNSSHTES